MHKNNLTLMDYRDQDNSMLGSRGGFAPAQAVL